MMKQFRMLTAFLLAAGLCCSAALCTACGQNNSQSGDDLHGGENSGKSLYVPEVPDSRVSEDEPGTDLPGALGETVRHEDKLEVTLDQVIEVDDVNKTQYRVVIAEMTISNLSSEKIDCSSLTHFSIIIDGEEQEEPLRDVQASVVARKYYTQIGSDLLSFNQAIEGGETIKGYICIYAPTAWTDMQLVYKPYKYYTNDRVILTLDEGQFVHYTEDLP